MGSNRTINNGMYVVMFVRKNRNERRDMNIECSPLSGSVAGVGVSSDTLTLLGKWLNRSELRPAHKKLIQDGIQNFQR
jgi:hypothetical protein